MGPQSATRVLVVDDSTEVREAVAVLLSSSAEVEVVGFAVSAIEALAVVARTCVDVVLMDVRMPGLDGIEAARRLRSRPQAPAVVLFTQSEPSAYRDAAFEAGAGAFLSKSNVWSELLPTIRRLAPAAARMEDPRRSM